MLPPTLTTSGLARKTTKQAAKELGKAAKGIKERHAAEYLSVGYRVLNRAGDLRNQVVHARPATMDDQEGTQRLNSWVASSGTLPHEAFWIDDDHLDKVLRDLAATSTACSAMRVQALRSTRPAVRDDTHTEPHLRRGTAHDALKRQGIRLRDPQGCDRPACEPPRAFSTTVVTDAEARPKT